MADETPMNIPGIGQCTFTDLPENTITIQGIGPCTIEHNFDAIPHIFPAYVGALPDTNALITASEINEKTAKINAEPGYAWIAFVMKTRRY